MFLLILGLIISLCSTTKSSNLSVLTVESSVEPNVNLFATAIQQVLHRISLLESESQKQTTVLNDISRGLSRVDGYRQDVVSTIDRSEARISQRLDAIKGDLGRVSTLQEVIREDIGKLEQQQMANKLWLSEQLRNLNKRDLRPQETEVKRTLNVVSADIEANLQVVQTTLNSLKRSSNVIEDKLSDLVISISEVTNDTELMVNNTRNNVGVNSFNKAIRNVLEEMRKLEKPNVFIRSWPSTADTTANFPKDCQEIQESHAMKNLSGVYRIRPIGSEEPVFVFCDMKTDGGGWTVIQSRQDGTVDFFRDWYEYKYGFGNTATEFWLGNDIIHRITHQNVYELRIDLEDFEGEKAFAKYNSFAIGSENDNYMIKLLGAFEVWFSICL